MPKRELNLKRLNYTKQSPFDIEDTDDRRKRKSRSKQSILPSIFKNYQQQETEDMKFDSSLLKRNSPYIQQNDTGNIEINETIKGNRKWRVCEECSKIAKFTNDAQIKREVKRRKNIGRMKPEDRCVICDKNEAFITEVDPDQDSVLLSLLYPRDFYDQYSREDKTSESLFNKTKNGSNSQLTPLKPPKLQTEIRPPVKRTHYSNYFTTKDSSQSESKTKLVQRKEFHKKCQKSNVYESYTPPGISRISGDEFTELYRRQGFRGWKLQKDKMLYPPDAFEVHQGSTSSYYVDSLGLHFDIPEHHLNSERRNLQHLKHIRSNTGSKPKTIFPPIKTAAPPPWSSYTGRLTL